jgi:phosphate starvation-inducible PhoH-like protein
MLLCTRIVAGYEPSKIKFTPNQKKLNRAIDTGLKNENQSKLVFVSGPAGSGKTMILCKKAFQKLETHEFRKIILTRPVVTCDEDIGYLPGDIHEKMDPWLKPFYDYCGTETINHLISSNRLEICPLGFMRGRTFDDTFVIADEMQNSTNSQMKMFLTRIGNNSMFAISGDVKQADSVENGMKDFIYKYQSALENSCYNEIEHIQFDETDIMRNPIVSDVLDIYNS